MNSTKFRFLHKKFTGWQKLVSKCLLFLVCLFIISMQPVYAGLNDDRYDGNMFVVYAGNGSLVPSRQTLAQSLAEHKPVFLAFYLDDSSDSKRYAISISRVQELYGRVAEIIPISVDSIVPKQTYDPTEPGYYYSGSVPQVLVFNQSGEVVLNKTGQVPFEEIDDEFRKIFNLLPRTETAKLKRRAFNEFSSELAK
ncbi:MAG: thylakoid membrane photosystem I accumulation factor [Nostoc sp. ZfuVER08]|uniref:Thylakoid membrane photosystem I accumulation factor n=1 Tax=Nostoc punctiforme FACHB-252 TaxID=1357509 RepID=A0ABR8HC27_NOSPU|nr:thylakoid membrane photosystem I accumulation factor [Nostoc punctiforme]MBD2612745.1 thylakoid membrane photosystem I accumulation factor [Nostoc punctiforme FACHB-252]MBL1198272.1 thioredoxin family protein [Nostoc sp. GBBB01]MDZ8011025.1 thylakoid membrane photosystem I accumulation factor [Nostoc sp. ZfuVER08]